MAKQTINIGSGANARDGDPLRTAFTKINDNFNELYNANGDAQGTTTDVVPSEDATYNLGSADKQWADLHVSDFFYLNGARLVVAPDGTLLINNQAGAVVQAKDITGSVFSDDSTLLVDAVNSTFNLDGTIKGHIIPDTDSVYDLGSSTNRFKTLWLAGNTLKLGELSLRYTNGGLGVSIDQIGGEYHGSGWWETEWLAAGQGPVKPGLDNSKPMVKHQHQTDGDTEGWQNLLTNLVIGDTFIFAAPLDSEVTVTLTSDVYVEFVGGTTYYYWMNVDIGPNTLPTPYNQAYIYTLYYPVIVDSTVKVKYTPSDAANWASDGGDPTSIEEAVDKLAARDATSLSGTITGDILDQYGNTTISSSGAIRARSIDGEILGIAADDSTVRPVPAGGTISIKGTTGISTSSDADGNITIEGPDVSVYLEISVLKAIAAASVDFADFQARIATL